MECVRLRVKDVEFERREIIVREGKGNKDRVTMLPESSLAPLQAHLLRVRALHEEDLAKGYGAVYLPYALEKKYPAGSKEWGWQYVFPSRNFSVDPRSGVTRRHHVDEKSLQRAIKRAALQADVAKLVTPHSFRFSMLCANEFAPTLQ
jgi:integrase